MKHLYVLIVLMVLIVNIINAQFIINERAHLGYPASVYTGVAINNYTYYATGLAVDSISPFDFTIGNVFSKYNSNGQLLLHRLYTDTSRTYENWEAPFTLTNDHGLLTTGYSFENGDMKGFVIKYDTLGNILFRRDFYSLFYPIETFISPSDILVLDNNDFIISAMLENNEGTNNTTNALYKFNETGELEWEQFYDKSTFERPYAIIEDQSDGFIIGTWTSNTNTTNNNFIARTYLFKVDDEGVLKWEYTSPVSELYAPAYDIIQTPDGGIVIATAKGIEEPINLNNSDLWWDGYIFKINADRQFEWGVDLRGVEPSENFFNRMITVSDGSGFVAAGRLYNPNIEENGYDINGWLVKVSPSGDSLWSRVYNVVSSRMDYHEFNDLKECPDGGFLLCGQARIDFVPDQDGPAQQTWLVKTDEYGCLVPGCHLISNTNEVERSVELKLYPNPTQDYLYIYHPPDKGYQDAPFFFEILDIKGQVMTSFQAQQNDITHVIPLSLWPKGQYWLSISTTNGKKKTYPFIIQ